jgi:hypothetical protein
VFAQQMPSLHAFDAHCTSNVQLAPAAVFPVQFPLASQTPPMQVSASFALTTVVHAPVPETHVVHVPVHVALEQQKPSLQTPVAHCKPAVQAPPGATSGTQAPPLLQ